MPIPSAAMDYFNSPEYVRNSHIQSGMSPDEYDRQTTGRRRSQTYMMPPPPARFSAQETNAGEEASSLLKKYRDALRGPEAGNEPAQLGQQDLAPQQQSSGAGSWLGQEQGKPWDLEARDPRGDTGRGIAQGALGRALGGALGGAVERIKPNPFQTF